MNGSPLLLDRAELDDRSEFRDAVLAGLERRPRAIPAKFLYDARGSALFDAICELPEYYLTRTETDILRRAADDIAAMALFLAADDSAMCTAQDFIVDGGWV